MRGRIMSDSPSGGHPAGGPVEWPAGARILVVEDFDGLRDLMTQVLTTEGYHVVAVGTVSQAVSLCTSEHFDLLLTDYRLAGGNGTEIARQAVAHNPDIRVLLVSGSRESALDLELPGTAVRFLQKPVAINDLSLCVRQLLSRPPG
jgi:DNA-binding NtrC family response regulator